MLPLSSLVSIIRCFLLYNTGFQLESHHLLVPQLPHLAGAIPLPTRLLRLFSPLHLGKADAHPHNRVHGKTRRWRLPLTFRDYQLYGLEPLLPLRIVTIAHADKTVTILHEQLLRAFLVRLEM